MEIIASFIYSDLIKQDKYYLVANKGKRVASINATNNQDAIEQFREWIKHNKNKTDKDLQEYLVIKSK